MLEIPRVEEVMMEGEECRALRPLWEEIYCGVNLLGYKICCFEDEKVTRITLYI